MKATEPASLALPPGSHDDWRGLTDALRAMADDNILPPCRVNPEAFTSDLPEDRSYAATRCKRCPALDACAAFGQHEPFHVWGGIDRAPRSRPRGAQS